MFRPPNYEELRVRPLDGLFAELLTVDEMIRRLAKSSVEKEMVSEKLEGLTSQSRVALRLWKVPGRGSRLTE